jgi:hypothetical protein
MEARMRTSDLMEMGMVSALPVVLVEGATLEETGQAAAEVETLREDPQMLEGAVVEAPDQQVERRLEVQYHQEVALQLPEAMAEMVVVVVVAESS